MASLVEKINGEGVYVSRGTHVVDNLTSTSAVSPLSARQGKVLNEKIEDTDSDLTGLAESLGDAEDLPNPLLSTNENIAQLSTNLVTLNNTVSDIIHTPYLTALGTGSLDIEITSIYNVAYNNPNIPSIAPWKGTSAGLLITFAHSPAIIFQMLIPVGITNASDNITVTRFRYNGTWQSWIKRG